ncbi:annexin A7-like isoform X4 [Octopus sinensis]|uniref:Annexin A7-like isoform X4 n=1 Tax=Octopus sinensis TaxID=2607531 RepID=A0A7E6FJ08_9MOLL|nr:annexin A7-like isoform X4 [Octopus sinensis]
MEANIRQTEEPNDGPPGYYENPGYLSAFEHPTTSGHPAQAGCPPQPGYLSQPGYPPQPGYLAQPRYPPQPGHPPQPGYLLQPPLPLQQRLQQPQQPRASAPPPPPPPQQQQQQQQSVIIQYEQPRYFVWSMVKAVLVTFFCFAPTGIAAIFYASKANVMADIWNIEAAKEANAAARLLIKVSFVVGILVMSFGLILPLINAVTK